MQDFGRVAIGDRPPQLVAPGLLDLGVLDPSELRAPPHLLRKTPPHLWGGGAKRRRGCRRGRMLPDADYVFKGAEAGLDCLLVSRFGVDPDQRLGAACSKENPAPVSEVELEAVVRADALHRHAGDLIRLVLLE